MISRAVRDTVLFVVGLAGIVYETVGIPGRPDPTLLLVFAAMVGLPAFLRADDHEDRGPE